MERLTAQDLELSVDVSRRAELDRDLSDEAMVELSSGSLSPMVTGNDCGAPSRRRAS